MDDASDEEVEFLIADLAVFYKGAVTFSELEHMPLSKVYRLNKYADKMNKEIERQAKHQR